MSELGKDKQSLLKYYSYLMLNTVRYLCQEAGFTEVDKTWGKYRSLCISPFLISDGFQFYLSKVVPLFQNKAKHE